MTADWAQLPYEFLAKVSNEIINRINYEDLGKETANMVDKILKGEKVENIPVKVFKENLSVYVNTKVLKQLGITLPNEIKNDKAYVEIKE